MDNIINRYRISENLNFTEWKVDPASQTLTIQTDAKEKEYTNGHTESSDPSTPIRAFSDQDKAKIELMVSSIMDVNRRLKQIDQKKRDLNKRANSYKTTLIHLMNEYGIDSIQKNGYVFNVKKPVGKCKAKLEVIPPCQAVETWECKDS